MEHVFAPANHGFGGRQIAQFRTQLEGILHRGGKFIQLASFRKKFAGLCRTSSRDQAGNLTFHQSQFNPAQNTSGTVVR